MTTSMMEATHVNYGPRASEEAGFRSWGDEGLDDTLVTGHESEEWPKFRRSG